MATVGIDIGTTSIAVLAFDPESQTELEIYELPNQRIPADDEYSYCQDPETVELTVRKLLAKIAVPIEAITITGQVHGILYYDSSGQALSPLQTWLDRTSLKPIPGFSEISRAVEARTAQDLLLRETGIMLPAGYGLLTHYANTLLGKVPDGAVGFCGILEYITGKLTGTILKKSDPSTLASYGGYNPVTHKFDDALLDQVLGSSMKPKAGASFFSEWAGRDGSVARHTASSSAVSTPGGEGQRLSGGEGQRFLVPSEPGEAAGLYLGRVPVTYPVGDNQAGFLGIVENPVSDCLISIGTSGQLSIFSKAADCSASMELRPFFNRGYLHVGATLTAGKAYEAVHDFIASAFSAAGIEHIGAGQIYDIMLKSVFASVPEPERAPKITADGLKMVTSFNGTRKNPGQRGRIEHITLENFTLKNLVLAAVEGIVSELNSFRLELGNLFDPIARVAAAGSAVRKNPLFVQTIERLFGIPAVVVNSENGAALGAARIAATAIGSPLGELSVR